MRRPLLHQASIGLLCLVLAVVTAGYADAAAFIQVGLAAKVSGNTVAVWAKVSASPQVTVASYGVCVRNSSNEVFDFPKDMKVTLSERGREYYKTGEAFPVGSYTYYPCIQGQANSMQVGASQTFTVTSGAASSETPTAVPDFPVRSDSLPPAPRGYTRRISEDFVRAAGRGQFESVYGSEWAGHGANSNTVPTTARDNGRYRPDKVLSTQSGVSGASDGNILDFFVHSETLADDDVIGATALSAAPLPMGWKGLTCGRFSIRYRADKIPGYKQAHLLWPESGNWDDGEIDFPENEEFGAAPFWAVHIPGTYGTSYAERPVRDKAGGLDHGAVPAKSANDWHVATIDLKPGSVSFEWDGKVVGRATGVGENGIKYPNNGAPTKPMVYVLQTETSPWDGGNPSPTASGHQQVDWVTIDAC